MNDLKYYMHLAIEQARIAEMLNEVPIGSVLVDPEGRVKQTSHNTVIKNCDPTAHAEMNVIRMECYAIQNERLPGYQLISTLEPCPMCASAISQARIARVHYGASDSKSGGIESGPKIFSHSQVHLKPKITKGTENALCSELLKNFFKSRR